MSAKRRYFVAEGPEAESLKKEVLDRIQTQHDQRQALQKLYGSDATWANSDGTVVALAYAETNGAPPEIPEGLKLDSKRESDGKTYFLCIPDRRKSAGKRIAEEFAAIKGFSGSAHIVDHFGASRWAPQSDGMSRTGMSMAISVAGIAKGQIVLSVPASDEEPFSPPPCLREIKKSEFVALTED